MINFDEINLDMSKDITPTEDEEKKDSDDQPGDETPADETPSDAGSGESTDPDNSDADASDTTGTDSEGDGDGDSEPTEPEKPTPFHEHPDWKKMQSRLEDAERRAEQAERDAKRAAEIREPKVEKDPDDALTPAQLAVKRVRDRVAKKEINPQDQAEVTALVSEEIDKIKADRETKARASLAERQQEAQKQIDDTFSELGITDAKDQEKITQQVLAWQKAGMNISVETLKVAAENLKLRGELGQKPNTKPTQTEESKAKEAQAKADRDKANRQAKKPSSGGGKPQKKNKTSYDSLAKRSLEDIILEQAELLDK